VESKGGVSSSGDADGRMHNLQIELLAPLWRKASGTFQPR